MLKTCREKQPLYVSEGDEAILRQALRQRNYLAHRFFSSHDAELLDDQAPLVDELREIAALFAAAYQIAEGAALFFFGTCDADFNLTQLVLRHGLAWENVIMEGFD